jgi:hypothetical protein
MCGRSLAPRTKQLSVAVSEKLTTSVARELRRPNTPPNAATDEGVLRPALSRRSFLSTGTFNNSLTTTIRRFASVIDQRICRRHDNGGIG